ncbi:peptidylprolyl isomerase [Clostridium luticellarii]|uniref:Putative peptidyl-prolyl cis-trans isomerase Cbf2 n=1 Tax=Clostridium luticellarii TaxID=1691940 RepID=A0A2T0B422_9CLOT|nr:peptidylprolyl isomerase [Clostridium luticellarii]MCI1944880.1 peptidylprolyl isomerase [Clostridium luticellarii]MCI1968444.1 peptidylprolyl isomerase [Clostridium luticellarii]MCI1995442.1 peptidylprolyl isomerase [Clostridium luticellarii]MCI2039505.1 peptidylprolyl isomerase [Clostridium luticellarii]PRR78638.1 putative peptidyl-prolyl cis-trans isomerase Cbf2 precursor [Clostridium luticellarii]
MQNDVLAVVNGVEITEQDLQNTIRKFPAERQQYLRTENGRKQLLNEIISFELIYNYAKDNHMENSKNYLAKLEAIKKEMLTQTAVDKIMEDAKVTEDEVKDYYNVNKNMYKNPESVTAKHILVDSLEKANKILEEINSGVVSFENAAKKYSSCPSKAQGGNLGKFTRGQMVPEFENVAFNLEIGTISKPVKTQFGYHLIKVEEKEESSIKTFEEVKDSIKRGLLQERQAFRYNQFTEGLKNKYKIEIK